MYLDLWPINPPMIAIMDPAISQAFSVEYQTKKHISLTHFLLDLAGKDDMVSANGAIWKKWRSMFNPGECPDLDSCVSMSTNSEQASAHSTSSPLSQESLMMLWST